MTLPLENLVQVEIPVRDPEASLRFYAEAFGWKRVPLDLENYWVLEIAEGAPFGVSLVPSHEAPGKGPVLYFSTPDPSRVLERVRAGGGSVRFGPKRLPGYGSIYQVVAPDGNVFGLFTRSS